MSTKTVNTKTIGSIVRAAVGPYMYRTRGRKDFIFGMEVQGHIGNVTARFVNYSMLDDSFIEEKDELLNSTENALQASGYTTIREDKQIRVIA